MDPAHYLSSSYYEHWLTGVATLLVDKGLTSNAALDDRAGGRFPLSRPDRGTASAAPEPGRTEPRSVSGIECACVNGIRWSYARAALRAGKARRRDASRWRGERARHRGARRRQSAGPTYSVRFTPRELWGEGGADGATVNVDLWERYLEEDA